MSDQFWLTKAQLKRIEPFFPRTRGIPRVDDRRVVSGIVHVIRDGGMRPRGEARPAYKRAFDAQLAVYTGEPPTG